MQPRADGLEDLRFEINPVTHVVGGYWFRVRLDLVGCSEWKKVTENLARVRSIRAALVLNAATPDTGCSLHMLSK
jgi:hypothetical protein